MARPSAILSSSFSGKVEVDGLSEHFGSLVRDTKGLFCFQPLPRGWFLENTSGIWFYGSQVRFPFLFCQQKAETLYKQKSKLEWVRDNGGGDKVCFSDVFKTATSFCGG